MTPLRRLACVALLGATSSCSNIFGPDSRDEKLEAARERWRSANLHTYAFTLRRSCECMYTQPLYVLVLNDTVAGVLDFATGQTVDVQAGRTVDDLFDFIQRAHDEHAHQILVQYDPTKGFPTMIGYDGNARMVDDEISLLASDVHPVSPP